MFEIPLKTANFLGKKNYRRMIRNIHLKMIIIHVVPPLSLGKKRDKKERKEKQKSDDG